MKTSMYCMYDVVAEESGPIFEAKSDAVAIRSYYNVVKNHDNPEDFTLMYVGEFDREKCEVVANQRRIETEHLIEKIKEYE